jgi:hypothetical protein
MAGITALLNQKLETPQGEINQRLYYLAATPSYKVFHDVTASTSGVSGCVVTTPSMCNNSTPSPTGLTGGLSGYLVNPGYDEVTGLGSVNVYELLTNWYAGFPATTTLLSSSPNPAIEGLPVTLTATVATAGTHAPTGKVTFSNFSSVLGAATLSTVNGSQVATFTTSTLDVGSNDITAFYSGDAHNANSTDVLNETVTAPTFNWTASGTSGSVLSGQSATYNFTATPTGISTLSLNIAFACTPMATITCTFIPAQISAGSGPTPVQVTITTTGPNQPVAGLRQRRADGRSPWLPLAFPLAAIAMIGVARRRSSKRFAMAAMLAGLALLGLLVACGGGGGSSSATAGHTNYGKSGSTSYSFSEQYRRQLAASNRAVYSDGRQYNQQCRHLVSGTVKRWNDRRKRPLHRSHCC